MRTVIPVPQPTRRHALVQFTSAAVATAAPAFLRTVNAQGLTKIVFQLGWLAQAEQGGLWQAQANGFYRARGLDVEIKPGGPQTNVVQLFLAGNADIVEADTRANGLGTMSHERWKRFYDAMVLAGVQQPNIDIRSGYTLQFVNKKS